MNMKRCVFLLIILAGWFLSFGGELPAALTEMKEELDGRIKIGSINDDTIRDDDDQKIEVFKFHTYQDERNMLDYRMRVTIELTSKSGETRFAQLLSPQRPVPPEYTGESDWEFQLPHGDLEKAKLTAYAVQYGFFKDGVFVPVAEEFDDVDSAEEITERTTTRLNGLRLTGNSHWYRE
jgi:hypothetical protein